MKMLNVMQAASLIQAGGVIAYPTEAVFGLGCDPQNEHALQVLRTLKARDPKKGMILIASEVSQLLSYIDLSYISANRWASIQATWPGPYTWVFPASPRVSSLIRGEFTTVAVRVTAHPIASALCQTLKAPVVSTSANIATFAPLRSAFEVLNEFTEKIQGVVEGEVGDLLSPTQIRDAVTDKIYR